MNTEQYHLVFYTSYKLVFLFLRRLRQTKNIGRFKYYIDTNSHHYRPVRFMFEITKKKGKTKRLTVQKKD